MKIWEDPDLTVRAANCLQLLNVNTPEEAAQLAMADYCKIRNAGRHTIKNIDQVLQKYGYYVKGLAPKLALRREIAAALRKRAEFAWRHEENDAHAARELSRAAELIEKGELP